MENLSGLAFIQDQFKKYSFYRILWSFYKTAVEGRIYDESIVSHYRIHVTTFLISLGAPFFCECNLLLRKSLVSFNLTEGLHYSTVFFLLCLLGIPELKLILN